MTEPTDAELAWTALDHGVVPGEAFTDQDLYAFARAVLAKWGTPPAVVGEPECTCSAKDMPFGTCCKVRSAFERWYDEQRAGRLQPFDVFKGGWIERHRLSATPAPQPTQAQTGAVPLPQEPLGAEFQAVLDAHRFDLYAEADKPGIKGGQHGANN